MQGKQLRLIAIAMLGLALLLGLYGAGLGRSERDLEAVAEAPRLTQVVWTFREEQGAGTVLRDNQLQRVVTSERSADEVADAQPYLGRMLARPVTEGSRLSADMLLPGRPLLDALVDGQRAVAIQVDEVAAIGGHLRTGDRVDVLYYLKANKESGPDSTARRILQAVQVLAYGPEIIGEQEQERQARSRSVVLAVPETAMSELLLAENTGRLRLAVVGHQEPIAFEHAAVPSAAPASLRSLTGSQGVKAPRPAPAAKPGIELYLGEERRVVTTGGGEA